ncbi:hypothetical protein SDC9_55958 [bioreactor metagenome]|uniref:Uncharacterized protein n=1 Tax=bioreactor metagenome TaxID=1076179 RepID=A0A644X0F5_9ZZZZ
MNGFIYNERYITRLQSHLSQRKSKYITYPKFLFLCGRGINPLAGFAYEGSNRDNLDKFVAKVSHNFVYTFLSEKLWDDNIFPQIDLLTFEEFLVDISDLIVIFVESPGTFCELGAFSTADKSFLEKTVIVVDELYEHGDSFVIKGPVTKAKRKNSRVIFAQLESRATLSSFELRELIQKQVNDWRSPHHPCNLFQINLDSSRVKLKPFIYELLELLRYVQPILEGDLIQLYKKIKNFNSFNFVQDNDKPYSQEIKPAFIFKILITIGILEKTASGYLVISDYRKAQSFMFDATALQQEKLRNQILCRKYHYKDLV